MRLELTDLDTIKEAAIKKFDEQLAHTAKNAPLVREVAQLQAELEQIYRVVVLLQKNEPSMDRVAEIWGKMAGICDEFARRLSPLAGTRATDPAAYDPIFDRPNSAREPPQPHHHLWSPSSKMSRRPDY